MNTYTGEHLEKKHPGKAFKIRCNCQPNDKQNCGLPDRCTITNLVYRATITRHDTGTSETQTGCTVEFKQRHKQHKESFEDPEVNQTCLSQHIWKKLKQTQLTFLTLLFGVRLVEHLHTIQQLGCANFASWRNTTS